ncbi:MAG: type II toxin-antitoxin system VapB family antitoxin [Acidobacteriota bacterium]
MSEVTAKVFRNGRNQAIRIPVEFSFDTDTVVIEKKGDTLVVRPKPATGWDQFLADESLTLPEDFDTGEDPPPQDRPSL